MWRPWMLDFGHIRPGELDGFTPRELEAVMRDYQQRDTQHG